MPTYDYLCRDCGRMFEVKATIAEKSAGLNPECPACQSADTNQIITAGLLVQSTSGNRASGCCGPTPRSGTGCCG